MKTSFLHLIISLFLIASCNAQESRKNNLQEQDNKIVITYLGHSGWAIKTNNNFLIFDYQEKYDFKWDVKPVKNLASGYIISEEIKDYNVYVFTTHEHSDHYDEIIFDWEKDVKNIKYFFGWEASSNSNYNYLKAPRATYKDETIEIFTINSNHSGVPEVAYLVKIDDIIIYHNGDCKSDYKEDFKFLKTKTGKIDIAFANLIRNVDTHYFKQFELLIKEFDVDHFFPMHSINEEYKYKQFADLLKGKGANSEMHCAKIQGETFTISK